MEAWLLANSTLTRLIAYAVILLSMLALESKYSARPVRTLKCKRWANNLGLAWFSSLVTRLTIPALAFGAAVWAEQNQHGLLNNIHAPYWLKLVITVIVLDLVIYWQHRLMHAVPLLWRVHAVHHADSEVDASTGGRFHPIEIALSMLLKMFCVLLLGCPASAVIVFETLLNASAIFNHSNIRIPPTIEHLIRRFIVTPAQHRIHHSVHLQQTNSNFGFFLVTWDRIFKTYQEANEQEDKKFTLGLQLPKQMNTIALEAMIKMPFIYPKSETTT